MSALRPFRPTPAESPRTPAEVAGRIRDHAATLSNALEVVRLAVGPGHTGATHTLLPADRQVAALTKLAVRLEGRE